jgi:hypothetical protein
MTKSIMTYDLLEPLKLNLWQRILCSCLLATLFLATVFFSFILLPEGYFNYNYIKVIYILFPLILLHLLKIFENRVLYKTKIIGQLMFDEDTIHVNDEIIDLRKIKKLTISKYIRNYKSSFPRWKVSDKLQIELPDNTVLVFFVGHFSKEKIGLNFADFIDELSRNRIEYYRKFVNNI